MPVGICFWNRKRARRGHLRPHEHNKSPEIPFRRSLRQYCSYLRSQTFHPQVCFDLCRAASWKAAVFGLSSQHFQTTRASPVCTPEFCLSTASCIPELGANQKSVLALSPQLSGTLNNCFNDLLGCKATRNPWMTQLHALQQRTRELLLCRFGPWAFVLDSYKPLQSCLKLHVLWNCSQCITWSHSSRLSQMPRKKIVAQSHTVHTGFPDLFYSCIYTSWAYQHTAKFAPTTTDVMQGSDGAKKKEEDSQWPEVLQLRKTFALNWQTPSCIHSLV